MCIEECSFWGKARRLFCQVNRRSFFLRVFLVSAARTGREFGGRCDRLWFSDPSEFCKSGEYFRLPHQDDAIDLPMREKPSVFPTVSRTPRDVVFSYQM
jgi:hypothetical protein